MRYETYQQVIDGLHSVVLCDRETNSQAVVVPGIGFNLTRCRLYGHETIQSPPTLQALASRSSEFGVPLLWPPSRIRDCMFEFQGRRYLFPPNEGTSYLHGNIRNLPWRVIERLASEEEGASVMAEFRFDRFPTLFAYYPHPIVLHLTYRLMGGRLSGWLEASNEGKTDAPFGFGIHPYFTLAGDNAKDTEIAAPAEYQYVKDVDGFIRRRPEQTEMCGKIAGGVAISELPKEGGAILLRLADGQRTCYIIRRSSGIRIRLEFAEAFPYLAVFQPKWANAISLEPWSCITDAFNAPLTREWTGAAGLQGGQTVHFHWSWGIDSLDDRI